MIHPTIFDNIKVVLEGEVYDLDLAEEITVINREDMVDLASMSRRFRIQFYLANKDKNISAMIDLSAANKDIYNELQEIEPISNLGCEIKIHINSQLDSISIDNCNLIEDVLNKVWDHRPKISQKITSHFLQNEKQILDYQSEVILHFGRKINEDNVEDIYNLVKYTYLSLKALQELNVS